MLFNWYLMKNLMFHSICPGRRLITPRHKSSIELGISKGLVKKGTLKESHNHSGSWRTQRGHIFQSAFSVSSLLHMVVEFVYFLISVFICARRSSICVTTCVVVFRREGSSISCSRADSESVTWVSTLSAFDWVVSNLSSRSFCCLFF